MSRSRSRRRDDRDRRDESTSILVRNLDTRLTVDDVRRAFEAHGEIRDVYLPLDYYTKRPRGFGFVEFRNPEDSQKAVEEMNGKELGGSVIEACVARQKRKSPTSMRRLERRPRSRSPYRRSRSRGRTSYRRRSPSRTPPRRNRRRSYSR